MSNRSGTTVGYTAQYRESKDDKWESVPIKHGYSGQGETVRGIPYPALCGGILSECCLMGEAQAKAVAYGFAASYEATHWHDLEVRIVPHVVKYSLEFSPKDEEPK